MHQTLPVATDFYEHEVHMRDDRIDEVFERLEEMRVDLDYDPIVRGPKFLTNQVATCRNYTNEVQRYMRECQRYIRTVEMELRRSEADFELSYNDLMANDEEILAMRNLSRVDREAAANARLAEERCTITELEQHLTNARHVETIISDKLREMREVISAIRLQRDLIRAEIDTGNHWGTDGASGSSQHHDHMQGPAGGSGGVSGDSLVEALSQEAIEDEDATVFEKVEKTRQPKVADDDIDIDALFDGVGTSSSTSRDEPDSASDSDSDEIDLVKVDLVG
jgi:hypothetical protein